MALDQFPRAIRQRRQMRIRSRSAGHGVRTSISTPAPSAPFKSRTAAVSITTSPGGWVVLRITRRIEYRSAIPRLSAGYLVASLQPKFIKVVQGAKLQLFYGFFWSEMIADVRKDGIRGF